MTDTPLPGVPVDIPLPPSVTECWGYTYDAQFASFRFSFDHLIFDDGRSSGTGNSWAFSAYTRHRAVSGLLDGFDLGGSDHEAASVLLIDREAQRASICPLREARAFLSGQYPPVEEPRPEERAEAARRFDEMVDSGWREEKVDMAEVMRAMAEQRGRVGRMMSFLEMCPDAPERGRG
jgi:hypothetical protein